MEIINKWIINKYIRIHTSICAHAHRGLTHLIHVYIYIYGKVFESLINDVTIYLPEHMFASSTHNTMPVLYTLRPRESHLVADTRTSWRHHMSWLRHHPALPSNGVTTTRGNRDTRRHLRGKHERMRGRGGGFFLHFSTIHFSCEVLAT